MRFRAIPVAHPDHPLHRLHRKLTLRDLRATAISSSVIPAASATGVRCRWKSSSGGPSHDVDVDPRRAARLRFAWFPRT